MFRCTRCGSVAHVRTSYPATIQPTNTVIRYYQCTNINCSHTFVTGEEFIRSVATPRTINPVTLPGQGTQLDFIDDTIPDDENEGDNGGNFLA
ncbi:ogr/Delta-like zinc finger family protein [Salmonella enterica]|uniref:Zinc finger Ogr/Delta-type domain-containing protein n=1 Tax=Salmonella enterica I TaxID=59201 RepID=A0A5U3ERX8_SALET|nr:hypothetical protein [Salmonella enterica subsp. diarizonae]EBP3998762.1 hypothetical protein [Salmonella enterica subsp. enterica]ELB6470197.1 ogr/Delta-like zinc finger family protein [Salmonella enterica]